MELGKTPSLVVNVTHGQSDTTCCGVKPWRHQKVDDKLDHMMSEIKNRRKKAGKWGKSYQKIMLKPCIFGCL